MNPLEEMDYDSFERVYLENFGADRLGSGAQDKEQVDIHEAMDAMRTTSRDHFDQKRSDFQEKVERIDQITAVSLRKHELKLEELKGDIERLSQLVSTDKSRDFSEDLERLLRSVEQAANSCREKARMNRDCPELNTQLASIRAIAMQRKGNFGKI